MALRTAPERGRLLPDGRGPPHPDRLLGQKHGLKLLGELSARRNLELLHQPLDEGITQNAVQERVREDIVVDAAILRMEVGCGMLLVATVVHTASPFIVPAVLLDAVVVVACAHAATIMFFAVRPANGEEELTTQIPR